jgi:hypothetical protein
MKNKFTNYATKALGAVAFAALLYACNDDQITTDAAKPSKVPSVATPVGPAVGATECTVTNITANTTWTPAGNPYILYGDVRVNNNATLTIQAGVVVRGDKASRGTLTIERGSRILANGTSTNPIVFTSNQPVNQRASKDWGGLNIMGRATNNQGANVNAEGYPACVTAPQYGGTTDNDNSGVLRYVRIEYGGIPQTSVANSEKNGLTLYSVGSGTAIDHIQVSFGGDDAFEWFGGAVNAKYLISYSNQDDDFDSDQGYKGHVQYGIAIRNPAIADNSQSNGFESDTDADGINATRTTARFSNFTLIGPYDPACTRTVVNTPGTAQFQDGLHLRRNTGIDVYNSIITGWPRNQAFADASVVASPAGVQLTHNTAVKPFNVAASLCFTEPAAPNNVWTLSATNLCNNATVCTSSAITVGGMIRQSGLTSSAWTLANPSVTPASGSIVLTNGTNANALSTTFTANSTTATATTYFRGARRLADDNGWDFSGTWVNYDPQTAPYPN